MDDIIIIGSGAAGLTAAVYALRAGKIVRVFENNTFGGQINFAPNVENYPSIKQITGAELASNLTEQAIALGAVTEYASVESVKKTENGFSVIADGENFFGKAIIIATGMRHKKLGLENEDALVGEGISYCALCDGAFYKNKIAAVVGGGDAAFQEAIYLSQTLKKVYLIHRRDSFRAEQKLVENAKKINNIEFITSACITKLNGEKMLESVTYTIDSKEYNLEVDAIFVSIGSQAQNQAFKDIVKLDENGFILASENCLTSTSGIFAAGDCRKKNVRQLTTAVADGSVAALAACDYINNL